MKFCQLSTRNKRKNVTCVSNWWKPTVCNARNIQVRYAWVMTRYFCFLGSREEESKTSQAETVKARKVHKSFFKHDFSYFTKKTILNDGLWNLLDLFEIENSLSTFCKSKIKQWYERSNPSYSIFRFMLLRKFCFKVLFLDLTMSS